MSKQIQVIQVGMCPILNWPEDYNWNDSERHCFYGGYWQQYSGIGGIGDEIAMRMFFRPYTQYRAIKERYPNLYFRHYSVLHSREYDPNPLFNPFTILSLYEHNPYIDEVSYIDPGWILEKEYYQKKAMHLTTETEKFQWFLRCLERYMRELQEKNNEIALEDIIKGEEFEEDEPCLYLGEENMAYAQEALRDLPRPLIGIQVNKSADNIVEHIIPIYHAIRSKIPKGTIVCVGTINVPRRWLENDIVSFSGKTTLLQAISIIDQLDVFFTLFSGLMFSAFIRKTPTVTWADLDIAENLGYVDWYSKNLKIDTNLHRFVIGDVLNIDKVSEHVYDILNCIKNNK